MLPELSENWTNQAAVEAFITTPADYTDAQYTAAVTAASEWLFNLYRRWPGSTTSTVRPCATHAATCGYAVGSDVRCACTGAHILELPWGPIITVDNVVVAGDTLAVGTHYRVVPPNWVVRIGSSWPSCNDPALAPDASDPDAWYVTYTWGEDPPQLAQTAAAQLAAELLKQASGAADCALPPGTISATGLGATIQIDPETVAVALFAVGGLFAAYPPRVPPSVRIPGHRRVFTDTP